jgi:hypothetical protein
MSVQKKDPAAGGAAEGVKPFNDSFTLIRVVEQRKLFSPACITGVVSRG